MTIKDICKALEELAPLSYAEDFDNVGLLVGDNAQKVNKVLVTLDTLESVVDEAIAKNCELIVSFHPIIFSGLKKLTGTSYVERAVIKAIKNNIGIYAIHTALDNQAHGVSAKMAEVLKLQNTEVLIQKKGMIKKLSTYVPTSHETALREALFKAGAGAIGHYDSCSFNLEGVGTFRGNEQSKPAVGAPGELHTENEIMLSVVFEKHLESKVLATLFKSHPYEQVAYEIITTDNKHQHIGMGIVGELSEEVSEREFIDRLKQKFKQSVVKHSKFLDKSVKKVAVLGGSGAFAIGAAKAAGADIYVSADFKYHDFYQAENRLVLADIGHYESEQFTKNLLADYLTKKFRNFAVVLSEINTNPIKYS